MICYKDKTFCGFHKDCGVDCDRALTNDVVKLAKTMGLLICQFVDKPECFRSGGTLNADK